MPQHHRAVLSRKADYYLEWAASVGPECRKLIERIFTLVRHEEQAYRVIKGMQRLCSTYSAPVFETAALEANGACVASCKRVRGIIARQHAEQMKSTPVVSTITHANLRDPKTYH
jgi:hypothetical protein